MIRVHDITRARSLMQSCIDALYGNRLVDQRAMAATLEVAMSFISHDHMKPGIDLVGVEDRDFQEGYDCELCEATSNAGVLKHSPSCPNRTETPDALKPTHISDFM